MPTLENDHIVFRFPKIEPDAKLKISFNRTLRVPDDGQTYPLPAGLGRFAVRHAEDYADRLSAETIDRGGVILPMWQTEALWIEFSSAQPEWNLDFPVAIKIAAGKINAITGAFWRTGLHGHPQDYIVAPPQRWLDGFAVEQGIIRQFVAMPLGKGASFEEQLSGRSDWGGLQITVTPLKTDVWARKREEWERLEKLRREEPDSGIRFSIGEKKMGLTGGGSIKQQIYADHFNVEDWDVNATERMFVTIIHAKDWFKITGENNPNKPFAMDSYIAAKLPWFEYVDIDQKSLPGAMSLAKLKTIAAFVKESTAPLLQRHMKHRVPRSIKIGPHGIENDPIKTNSNWDR